MELKLAGAMISPWAASAQILLMLSLSKPAMAAMAPTPAGTAACMYLPRAATSFTASLKLKPRHRPTLNIPPNYARPSALAQLPVSLPNAPESDTARQ